MNILLVHASANTGCDPAWPALAAAFRAGGHSVMAQDASDRTFRIERDPVVYDLVLTLDASLWYLHNRLAIQGSYVAMLASFCMGDLYHLIQQDDLRALGVRAIFTNCYAYSQQASPETPVFYVWKPIVVAPSAAQAEELFPFGTVVPNVADRDFSLVQFVVDWLKKTEPRTIFPIFVPDSERMRLPAGLESHRVPTEPTLLFSRWTKLWNYIPAVRITDYRAGIIPTELVQSVAADVPPVIIAHPIVMPLSGTVTPIFASLKQLREALTAGLQGKSMAQIHIKPELLPTPEKFVAQVLLAYKSRRDDADSGRDALQLGSSPEAAE